jgi:hypothetical protein
MYEGSICSLGPRKAFYIDISTYRPRYADYSWALNNNLIYATNETMLIYYSRINFPLEALLLFFSNYFSKKQKKEKSE